MTETRWLRAAVRPDAGEDVRWLVLEADESKTGGWSLFVHDDLTKECRNDFWVSTLEEGKRTAQDLWGVQPEEWTPWEAPLWYQP